MTRSARSVLALGVASLVFSLACAISASDYKSGKVFSGDGTYYGPGGWEGGNCAIRSPRPAFYNRYTPIAINAQQYSGTCGACIEYWGNGKGSGANPIVGRKQGVIVDRCPECKYGDIDLSLRGDGRWKIFWKVIPCAGENKISFQFEGSNLFYWKLQPRGTKSPPVKVVIDGVNARRSQDNHWIVEKNFNPPVKVVVDTITGEHSESYLSKWNGVVYGGNTNSGQNSGNQNISNQNNSNDDDQSNSDDDEKSSSSCRKFWADCGKKGMWKNWNGRSYSKPTCCKSGSSCKFTKTRKFKGYRCVPN